MSNLPVNYAGLRLESDTVTFATENDKQTYIKEIHYLVLKAFQMAVKCNFMTPAEAHHGMTIINSVAVEERWSFDKTTCESNKYIGMVRETSNSYLGSQSQTVMPSKWISSVEVAALKLAEEKNDEEMVDDSKSPKIKYTLEEYRYMKKQQSEDERAMGAILEEFENMDVN